MKKLFCLFSFALLAFGFQGSVLADKSPDELVCKNLKEMKIEDEQEIAEIIRSYIAELDEPTLDQIIALSEIAEEVEKGKSVNSVCK